MTTNTPRFKVGDKVSYPRGLGYARGLGVVLDVADSDTSVQVELVSGNPWWFHFSALQLVQRPEPTPDPDGWRKRRDANLRAVFAPEPSTRRSEPEPVRYVYESDPGDTL